MHVEIEACCRACGFAYHITVSKGPAHQATEAWSTNQPSPEKQMEAPGRTTQPREGPRAQRGAPSDPARHPLAPQQLDELGFLRDARRNDAAAGADALLCGGSATGCPSADPQGKIRAMRDPGSRTSGTCLCPAPSKVRVGSGRTQTIPCLLRESGKTQLSTLDLSVKLSSLKVCLFHAGACLSTSCQPCSGRCASSPSILTSSKRKEPTT